MAKIYFICKLDRKLYGLVTPNIESDEVIITEEQIAHIKERHQLDFEQFESYIQEAIIEPDYIIEANKPNTALILKEIVEQNRVFKLVLRLKTSEDPINYKNSIITFMKTDRKEWKRLLKNKKILYNREGMF